MPALTPNTSRGAALDANRAALFSAADQDLWPGPHPCQTQDTLFPTAQTMAFKNEVVSDADIDRYNLPFQKGDGRWWTRDAERDYYLWGGISGELGHETEQEGWFYLYVESKVFTFLLLPGKFSSSLSTSSYNVIWEKILRIIPDPDSIQRTKQLVSILKDALAVYGLHGEEKDWPVETRVVFNF